MEEVWLFFQSVLIQPAPYSRFTHNSVLSNYCRNNDNNKNLEWQFQLPSSKSYVNMIYIIIVKFIVETKKEEWKNLIGSYIAAYFKLYLKVFFFTFYYYHYHILMIFT